MAEGEEACDPTCGSGSLLMKCGRRVQAKFDGSKKYALYGQESIGSTWALAKMNMFLHGEDNHRIEWGDTIRNPKLLDAEDRLKHFDVVVANPPFIRIHVYPNGDVEIEAPSDKETGQIRAAAQRRARWIFQHRNAAISAQQIALPREYVSGETHFYLGRRHKLIVNESSVQPSEVKLLRGKLVVTLPVADRVAVRRRLNAWYGARAEEYLMT